MGETEGGFSSDNELALNLVCIVFLLGVCIFIFHKYRSAANAYEVLPLGERAVKYDPQTSPARVKAKHCQRSVSVFEELGEA